MGIGTEVEAIQKAVAALEPLDQEGRERAIRWLASALGVHQSSAPSGVAGGNTVVDSPQLALEGQSAKQFLASKRPKTTVERVTCLAFYMTYGKYTPHFKTRDLSQLNLEAAGPPFSNIAQAAKDAVKAYYLASAGKQSRQVTSLGEAVVRALPDRGKVKTVLADERPTIRSRRRRP